MGIEAIFDICVHALYKMVSDFPVFPVEGRKIANLFYSAE
jgi:hypothetical protein